VRGPIELELVVLELWLPQAAPFRRGYEQHRELPPLTNIRDVYRFLIYLMYDAPPRECQKWLEAPQRFEAAR